MKIKVKIETEIDVKLMKVTAKVRYWEDSSVNGVYDEDGTLMPCRNGENWCPVIQVENGIIMNWNKGVDAEIHYKVCDCCGYELIDDKGEKVFEHDDYVPDILTPGGDGYGDYIIMNIDKDGNIQGWDKELIADLFGSDE